jgi:uncharacterized surface protein with fasciclin (FAS1) repeats
MANILTTIFRTRALSIFSTAIKITGFDKILAEQCDFTIFAPNNLAFAQLSKVHLQILTDDLRLLTEIVSLHIVPARLGYPELLKMCKPGDRGVSVTAIDSSQIQIDLTDGIKIGGATVLSTDTLPSNGILHTLDRVLMPDAIVGFDRSTPPIDRQEVLD